MRKTFIAIATITLAASIFSMKSEAMPLGGLGSAADTLALVEKSQYYYGGRNYCWYPDGWKGPGFYWCGYANRYGIGWGGPVGWRGWRGGTVYRGGAVYRSGVYRGGGAVYRGGAVHRGGAVYRGGGAVHRGGGAVYRGGGGGGARVGGGGGRRR